jgi:AraC-like DNA-binding protein
MFFFEKGEASHFIDFVEYPISDNSFFIISYNQIHYITARPDTINVGFAIAFDKTYFDFLDNELQSLFSSFGSSPAYIINGQQNLFSMLFREVEIELKYSKSGALVLHYVKILLTHISRLKVNNPQEVLSIVNPIWKSFLSLIEINFTNKKTVSEYAKLLNISTTQLNRISQKRNNTTALAVIHNRLNLEAKRKLFYTNIQIKEICFDLGFEDAGHFNNFFKRLNQQTPNEFRKSMSQIFN